MATELEPPKPVLVSVRDARRMLGNMSHNHFWDLAAAGEFEITGTKRKRLVFVRSLEAYADRQPRAKYSAPPPKTASALREALSTHLCHRIGRKHSTPLPT